MDKLKLFSLLVLLMTMILLGTVQCTEPDDGKMQAWQIRKYGNMEQLQLKSGVDIPKIRSSTQVLVKVHATSVNQIDVEMVGGYGRKVLNLQRWKNRIAEFPLTPGRDFVGVVVEKGKNVRKDIKIGDKVWGLVEPYKVGCHAEYVVVDHKHIAHKPDKVDDVGAAGLLYAGLTAWSSFYISGFMGGLKGAKSPSGGGAGSKICILGASGGVGTIAVQMAKAEKMEVTATCSKSAMQMVKDLGADYVIDYTADDVADQFAGKKYDVILDCAGVGAAYATKYKWKFGQYITLSPPLLNNTDNYGLIIGSLKSGVTLLGDNAKTLSKRKGLMKWGIFVAATQGIEYFNRHVARGNVKPVVDTVFRFNETYDAYRKVSGGHLRGKVVVQMK